LGVFEKEREEAHKRIIHQEIQQKIQRRDVLLSAQTSRICPFCQGKLYAHDKTSIISYLLACDKAQMRLRRFCCSACNHIGLS